MIGNSYTVLEHCSKLAQIKGVDPIGMVGPTPYLSIFHAWLCTLWVNDISLMKRLAVLLMEFATGNRRQSLLAALACHQRYDVWSRTLPLDISDCCGLRHALEFYGLYIKKSDTLKKTKNDELKLLYSKKRS